MWMRLSEAVYLNVVNQAKFAFCLCTGGEIITELTSCYWWTGAWYSRSNGVINVSGGIADNSGSWFVRDKNRCTAEDSFCLTVNITEIWRNVFLWKTQMQNQWSGYWSCISWITVLTDTQGDTQVGDTRYQDGQQGTFRDSCLGVL